ncbi:MAG: BadF/BadG/BcrA/BcrD ATPase family protein [Terracidiphilus sp.]
MKPGESGREVAERRLWAGVDVGSTTVKLAVCPHGGREILYSAYVRHESRQAETVLRVLRRAEEELDWKTARVELWMTGSGGEEIARVLGVKFVQEVTAVSLAVEAREPLAGSLIELGGQDAKIVVFEESSLPGERKKFASMNDKCAGGTGAVIEKIAARLGLSMEQVQQVGYDGVQLHPVAGKCGVFAETDITGLQKQGVPPEQLMASLFEAIVLQNLSVLTRGRLLRPRVLLLGGPNFFLPGLRQAWSHHLRRLWREEKIALPAGADEIGLISAPANATLFGALGAIEYGRTDEDESSRYAGCGQLERAIAAEGGERGSKPPRGLAGSSEERDEFLARFTPPPPPVWSGKAREPVFLGIDGGSTTIKAVCLSRQGEVLASSYRISRADPIADAIAVLDDLKRQFDRAGVRAEVLGATATGYSRAILAKVLHTDHVLVETVAHAKSALRVYPGADAIVDVGGQDIKIILLQNGVVRDFRLNTQCSAGNGYFLQSAAERLGIGLEDFARVAFAAKRIPVFSYGCAVFLQADIVNFQRQGWRPEEIIAGLAEVLPKNVFLYVAGVSNVARLGRRFLLQGGTQRNLAVVKAEIDFIRSHYFAPGEPEVRVHPYCGEAGGIGAALDAMERYREGAASSFIGFAALGRIRYTITHDETTRCSYCANRCLRTFVEIAATEAATRPERIILATCERGELADTASVRGFNQSLRETLEANPSIPAIAARAAFEPQHPAPAVSQGGGWLSRFVSGGAARRRAQRAQLRIGIPRVLNLYACAPFFTAYLESLGVAGENIVYSGMTTQSVYRGAQGLAAIDPCYPTKVTVAHVHELLRTSDTRPLDALFFPMIDVLETPLEGCVGANACPAGAAAPEAVKAVFMLSRDTLRERGIRYLNPLIDFSDKAILRRQMYDAWREMLAVGWEENAAAVEAGLGALRAFDAGLRSRSRRMLDRLEEEGRIGLALLGRPYHHDPGLNQGILEEFQKLGYPIFSQTFLPLDGDLLDRLFGDEVRSGVVPSPLSIADVWKNSNSAGTNHKLWAAKFAARHPNLIPIELANFKCGHDAFISRVVQGIIECSGKPHFCFGDLDENKPVGALRIRIETMHHFLRQYESALGAAQGAIRHVAGF